MLRILVVVAPLAAALQRPVVGARGAATLFAKKNRKERAAAKPERAVLPEGAARPRLVVFDLDATLWKPELYQLRKRPKANKDVVLCEGVADAVYDLATGREWASTVGAVASRASEAEWAEDLLAAFEIEGSRLADVLPLREIYPGNKKKHFQRLRERSGVAFSDMIFFDDYTENCGEVTQLGVLCVHTPRGLTREHWAGGLRAFARLKRGNTAFMGRMLTLADLREVD